MDNFFLKIRWLSAFWLCASLGLACQAAPEPRADGPLMTHDSRPRPPVDRGPGDGPVKDRNRPSPDSVPRPDLLPTVAYSGMFPAQTGDLRAYLTVGGQRREVRLYRPAAAKAGAPLLLAFHGTHGKGWDMLKPGSVAARELADKQGLLVIAPQARKMSQGDWDNHGSNDVYWETHPNTNINKNNDLLLIQAIIAEAHRAYRVDLRRVYTLGHSNGGFFAVLAAVRLPNRIAGFVSNSAGLVRCKTTGSCSFSGSASSCAALSASKSYCRCSGDEKPVALASSGRKPAGYLVHAADDTTVSVVYTCDLAARMTALGYPLKVRIVPSGGHGVPYPLAIDAWDYLSAFKLP